jgi:hypothetical protein
MKFVRLSEIYGAMQLNIFSSNVSLLEIKTSHTTIRSRNKASRSIHLCILLFTGGCSIPDERYSL